MSLTISYIPLSQIYRKCTFHQWTKVRLSWWSIWRCTYRIWLIHFLQWSVSNRKGRRENFQLPCFNPRQQAKLLKFSFSLSYSSFDLFYDLLKRLILSRWAKFAQNNIVVEEEAGAVVVPVMRNGNIFIYSVGFTVSQLIKHLFSRNILFCIAQLLFDDIKQLLDETEWNKAWVIIVFGLCFFFI